jgi:lambda family phage tail tape measure protein
MTEQNIGAARVHLVVDATDYDAILTRALNSAVGFGAKAEAAFDRSAGGTRRASARLLDYINDLKRVSTEQTRFAQLLQRAAKEGADPAVLKAATAAWNDYAAGIEVARIKSEGWAASQERAKAAARTITQEQQREALGVRNLSEEYAKLRVEAIAAENARRSQQGFNSLVAPGLGSAATANGATFSALVAQSEQYEQNLAQAHAEALAINVAFDNQRATLAQMNINSLVAPGLGRSAMGNGATVSALQEMVVLEGQLEAEAHNINSEYQRWQTQIDAIGKDFYEIQIMQAKQRYGSAADPIVRQIEQFRTLNTNIHGSTVNTKQLQQAIRFLPAQFTDIGVSAAAGMNPLLIALQQGGQILDQFRLAGLGTKETLLTVGRYALRLVNPITVGVGAVAALAFASYDAAKAMEDLAIATAKGNQVAGSAESLYALVDSISQIEKVNTGSAEAAVARLASGGKLAGDNLRLAAEATARWAAISGESVDDVAGRFEAIAKGPLEAIESGQVRVTQKQYDYIKSLVDSGNQQQAVNELTRIFYDTVNNNSTMVENHLSYMSRMWKEIKDGIGGATRELGQFTDFLVGAAAEAGKKPWWQNLTPYAFLKNTYSAMQGLDAPGANAAPTAGTGPLYDPDAAKRTKQRADALAQWNATADQAAQRQLQLNKLRAEGKRLGQDEATINAVLLRQQKEWAKQDSRKGGQGRDGTQAIRDAAAAEIASITTQTKLVQSQYEQREISVRDYYAKLHKFADDELAVTLRSIDQQKKAVAGRKDAAQRLDELESQAASARERYAQRDIDLKDAQAKAVFQLEVAYRQFTRGLSDSNAELKRNMDAQVAQLTMGSQEYARMQARNELLTKQEQLVRDINRQVEDRSITAEEGEKRVADAIANTATQLAILKSGYADVEAAQADFFVGSQKAWKDWQEDVGNVAQEGYKVMTDALNGFSDAITDGINGNLDSFKTFFDDLQHEILSFIVKQQLTKWLKSLGSESGGSGSSGFFASFVGALFGSTTANAQGGVYAGSGLSAYRNSIVSQPTVFPFARGGVPNMGLMGERSGKPHEAIFPLTRTSGGDLGVKVVESGKRGPITINQPIYIQGRVDDRTTQQVAAKSGREVTRAMSRNNS